MKERICSKCGYCTEYEGFDSQKFCPQDGTRLRDICLEREGEIFLAKYPDENISCVGIHLMCNGYVYEYASSDGGVVYTCKACCLRIKLLKG